MKSAIISFFLFATVSLAQTTPANTANAASAPDQALAALADRFFDQSFKFNPTAGTAAGFHQYDNQLEDYSRAAIDGQIAMLKDFQKQFAAVDAKQLSPASRVDHWLLVNDINGRLLALESIGMWEKNPDQYSGSITNSIFVIMSRTFAPPDERLKSVIAREKQVPAVFQAARQNLKNPPPIKLVRDVMLGDGSPVL